MWVQLLIVFLALASTCLGKLLKSAVLRSRAFFWSAPALGSSCNSKKFGKKFGSIS